MSFRFKIKWATRIAGVDTVTGTLESGALRHGVTATARIPQGSFTLLVRTVAFVDPPRSSNEYTLTIDEPGFALALLDGATIVEAEKMPFELETAIRNLYRELEHYRQPARSTWSPYSGISEMDAARLYSKPLRQLSADDLERYARHAMTTWGDGEEFKHYLPRMLELLATEPEWTDAQILIGRLNLANWKQWPTAERDAVTSFLEALWSWALEAGPDVVSAGELLRGFAEAGLDVGRVVDEWHANRSLSATRQIARLLLEEKGLRTGRGLDRAWGTAATLVTAFLGTNDVRDRLRCTDVALSDATRREFQKASEVLTVMRSTTAE